MASTSSGVPPETSHQLYMDSLRLIGNTTVVGTFYGMMTVAAGMCVQTLVRFRKRRTPRRLAFLLAYVAVLWASGTLYVAGLALSTQTTYIDHRLFSPGPYAYYKFDQPGVIMTMVTYFVGYVFADGMMVWRFRVIWRDSKHYWWLVPIPCLAWATNVVVGLLADVFISMPQHAFYSTISQKIVVPNMVLTICLNVFTTTLMAGRLLMFRRRMQQHEVPGSSTPSSKQYTNVAAMLVESCTLYTTSSVLFLGFYLANHPAETVMVSITSQMQLIGPLLVMLRISRGVAWKESTHSEITTGTRRDTEVQFARGSVYGDGEACGQGHGGDPRGRRHSSGEEEDEDESGEDGSKRGSQLESPRLPRMSMNEKRSESSISFAEHELDGVEGVVRADELVKGEV
ncbi:hypothetical protein CONPUDRAFT_85385 [Coniophora puteana RWD-64-598 SS2]|uniref:Uncharacterized protein n=1 Tax=Coniophora puteana (strain RWD-64-598) TaxID=741705 RepID=A0A5M3MAN9_CONPW|nr:uncharacterized protein CONPUDRAFT_85385 [Coniophora puteana RWD-64-598 SS2]EIW75701.1 hypothetical protein CONPUDRAFT_85385 [Coniophora puteana RWD-64-598 SS2]